MPLEPVQQVCRRRLPGASGDKVGRVLIGAITEEHPLHREDRQLGGRLVRTGALEKEDVGSRRLGQRPTAVDGEIDRRLQRGDAVPACRQRPGLGRDAFCSASARHPA